VLDFFAAAAMDHFTVELNAPRVQFMKANNAPLGASLAVSAMGIVSMISLVFLALNRRWLRKRGS